MCPGVKDFAHPYVVKGCHMDSSVTFKSILCVREFATWNGFCSTYIVADYQKD